MAAGLKIFLTYNLNKNEKLPQRPIRKSIRQDKGKY
jgi:hypothetical protein